MCDEMMMNDKEFTIKLSRNERRIKRIIKRFQKASTIMYVKVKSLLGKMQYLSSFPNPSWDKCMSGLNWYLSVVRGVENWTINVTVNINFKKRLTTSIDVAFTMRIFLTSATSMHIHHSQFFRWVRNSQRNLSIFNRTHKKNHT